MYNKTNLIITGATVAMLLLPMKTDAQKLESCLRKNAPESVIQKARKAPLPLCRSWTTGQRQPIQTSSRAKC